MYLIRVLILCFATVALLVQPSRAEPACPMSVHDGSAVSHQLHRADGHPDAGHRAHLDHMACCAPAAVRAAAPAPIAPTIWRASPSLRPIADRDRKDAARPVLRRPPRSA